MHRGEVFWGGMLVILGTLFLLKATGHLSGDVFGWFWPLVVLAAGVWMLTGSSLQREGTTEPAEFSVPLGTAKAASLTIEHGAGHIDLRSGANPGDFLTGTAGNGTSHSARLNGERLEVRIEAGTSIIPFIGTAEGVWEYRLNRDVPTTLVVHSGANRLDLDLADLQVNRFSFGGGASRLHLTLPAAMDNGVVDIAAGAASIELRVPPGLALRLRNKGVGTLHLDAVRYPARESSLYQSVDFETATHRADVTIEGGATTVRVT